MEALRDRAIAVTARSLLAAAATMLVLASPAAGDWSVPQRIARSRVWAYQQLEVTRSDSGSQAVAWSREETLENALGGVEAATKPPKGAWHLADLESGPRDQFAGIALGSQADGRSVLAWELFPEHASDPVVERLEEPAGGRWSRPARIVAGEPEAGAIAMDVAPDGRAALAFHVGVHVSGIVFRSSDGRWGRPRRLAHAAIDGEPHVALLPDGGAVIAWESGRFEAHGESVKAAFVSAKGKQLGPVQTLARGGHGEPELELAGNLRGEVVLAWRPRGAKGPLVAAARSPGRRFGAPVTISGGGDSEPSVAVDAEGDATVLFTHVLAAHVPVPENHQSFDPTGAQRTVVEEATRPAAGTWRAAVDVPTPAGMSTLVPHVIAAPASGELLATWTVAATRSVFGVTGPGGPWPPESSRAYTSTRMGAGAWSSPIPIGPTVAGTDAIALSDDGRATAVWTHEQESDPELERPFVNVEVSELTP
jgi:hypothetical protein